MKHRRMTIVNVKCIASPYQQQIIRVLFVNRTYTMAGCTVPVSCEIFIYNSTKCYLELVFCLNPFGAPVV